MSLDEIKSGAWPHDYADRFGPQSSIFIEEEYGSDGLTCFEHVGDLKVSGDELRRELLDRTGGTAFLLVVDGALHVDGFLDLQGSQCIVVTNDLRCEDLFADSYSYVSVAGDLRVERALVSCMMTDCGIAVDGEVSALFIGTAAHAAHHLNAAPGTIILDAVSHLIADEVGSDYIRKSFVELLRSGEHPFKATLEELRAAT